MKASREPRPFEPVVLTLENEAEVRLFIGLLGALSNAVASQAIGEPIDVYQMYNDLRKVSGLEYPNAFEYINLR